MFMGVIQLTDQLRNLDELATKIKYISGYSLEELLGLFAAGYTLTPPEKPMSMEELAKLMEEE